MQHHTTTFIVKVGKCKCFFRQIIKEFLLHPDIFIKGFVIVEMIVRDIGEYATGEFDAGDAVLVETFKMMNK